MQIKKQVDQVDGLTPVHAISFSDRVQKWRQQHSSTLMLLTPLLLYMGFVFAIPVVFQVVFGFFSRELYRGVLWRPVPDFTLENFTRAFSGDEVYIQSLIWTVGIAFFTSSLSIILSLPVAYFLARYNPFGKSVIELSFLLPVFGEIFTLFALAFAFAPQGPVNWLLMGIGLIQEPIRFIGSPLVVIVWMSIPTLSVLLIRSALVGVDVIYEEAAQTMGAGSVQTFRRVTIPMAKRGIMGALLLQVSAGVGVFTLPLVLVGPYNQWLANKIHREVTPFFNYPMASALGVILTAVSAIFLYLYLRTQEADNDS